ncbi:MAG: c-type cytochrome biogenesis protein CcmI [Xanthobacteraceae bacterium]|nr:c-type cytochrome biogenesis protein CcmI [Xanthobacteraceae bacterium]
MMLWWILALMTITALGAVVWPLLRARGMAATGSDLAVYRDQLEEIERDRSEHRIGPDEAEAARVEVSRRLLAAANAANTKPESMGAVGRRRLAALAVAGVVLPLVAVALYGALGSPELPGQPLASRSSNSEDALARSSIGQLLARVEAHLAENPNDGRGWEIVAPVYMKLERYDDAAKARRQAILLLGETPARDVDLGEAMTAAANGVISEEAKVAFDRAIKLDAENYKAQFYLGLAAEQDGNMEEASRIWQSLIAKAPADAPWLVIVRQALERVDSPAAGALAAAADRASKAAAPKAEPGPRPDDVAAAGEMTDAQRSQMIRGMVDRLASRLHDDGSDLDGWLRLLRAYKVLGENAKAKEAVAEARAALANEPDKLRRLDAAIKDLDVGG